MRSYSDLEALIDDPRVLARTIADVDEPLVDASTAGFAVDRTRTDVQQLSDNPFQLRSGVLERLVHAQGQLPAGFRIQLKEGWRPVWVQECLWRQSLAELRDRRPELSDAELRRENARFTAPPDSAPPHSTGGAADVILLRQGEPADMGWGFNQPGEGSRTAYPVPEDARRSRDILATAMDAAGFVNYPAEWWHWSYGDRYWAFQTSQQALYGPR